MDSLLTTLDSRVESLFAAEVTAQRRATARVFAYTLPLPWLLSLVCAAFQSSDAALQVSAIGAAFTTPAFLLVFRWPGSAVARHAVVLSSFCMSALLVHALNGRVEAHFYEVGLIALLFFFRDYAVYATALLFVLAHHFVFGSVYPSAVFENYQINPLAAFEHTAWDLVVASGMLVGVYQSRAQIRRMCRLQVQYAEQRDTLARRVESRAAALNEERRLLESILDRMPYAVFWKDRQSVYMGCNRLFAESAGMEDPKDIVGLTDYDLPWTAQEIEWYRHCDNTVMEEGKTLINCEETQRTASGEEVVVWTSKTPLLSSEDNEIVGMIGIFADVTEKHKASQERQALLVEVEQRKAMLEAIFDTAADAILVVDSAGRISRANQSAAIVFGIETKDLIGRSISDFMPTVEAESHDARLLAAVDRNHYGVLRRAIEVTAKRADGSSFAAELSISKMAVEGDVLFTGIVRDVSDRQRLEEQLYRAQKLESIGELAAGLAHEINTPLQFVSDNIEYLFECTDSLLSAPASGPGVDAFDAETTGCGGAAGNENWREEFPAAIEESREGIRRIIEIVRAMKTFSHPGGELTCFSVNAAASSAATVSTNRWKYSAELRLELDPLDPWIEGSATEFNQALLNLVVNAADAVLERHGETSDKRGLITLRTRLESDWVVVEVEDNGSGVPEEIRSKIFDPFFTTKDVGKGTGQGLSLVYNVIASQHGGEVDFTSTPGEGTVFTIRIPRGSEGVAAEHNSTEMVI